jgi:hypothetical protein
MVPAARANGYEVNGYKTLAASFEQLFAERESDGYLARKRARWIDERTFSAWTRARHMNDTPVDLDKHRGMAAQKATDMRRLLAEVESNAKIQRDQQAGVEKQLLAVAATSWPEAAAKARYVLNLYAAQLAPADSHHRDLVAAVLADFVRLSGES